MLDAARAVLDLLSGASAIVARTWNSAHLREFGSAAAEGRK
ncbi:hypothetical protein MES5069_1360005 [Mesorhizobium escarrei]|uniref:Uncharacterized protein n=1 Tax=Mesorhizobium escarrei TaxID=666018 RepID=A0ABN8JH47_9HYPH|nr:hypothetical protein MES5069_1360005 [Mesorhizobium escarrei]